MRSAIAIGWLTIAILGFLCGNLLNLGPDDLFARAGAMLYALLLAASLIIAILNRLRGAK